MFFNLQNIIFIFSLVRTTIMSNYKRFILIFGLITTVFYFFFSLCKMVDNEYSLANYKSLEISNESIAENPES